MFSNNYIAILSSNLFAFSSTGENVSFGPAFVKRIQMPHSSLNQEEKQHKWNYPVSIYEDLLEKKMMFFFVERMLNEIMNT